MFSDTDRIKKGTQNWKSDVKRMAVTSSLYLKKYWPANYLGEEILTERIEAMNRWTLWSRNRIQSNVAKNKNKTIYNKILIIYKYLNMWSSEDVSRCTTFLAAN